MSVYLNFNSLFLDEFSAVSNASKKDLNRFNYQAPTKEVRYYSAPGINCPVSVNIM